MIYLLNDRLIHIQWSIFKGTSQVREDFSRALVKVFLIGPDEKYLLDATAQNGTLAMDVPQGLPEGAYSIECIYVKNYESLLPVRGTLTPSGEPVCHRFPWGHPHNPHSIHPHDHRSNDRCLMRSRMDYVFALTSIPSEADGVSSDGEATLRFKSSVASYGYDGLSAYEIAVMRGDFNGSEGEWLDWMASGKIDIDDALSETSGNPVENRVMTKEFNKKQNSLVSGKNIKTVNGQSILGEGNISITGEGTAITVENEFGQSTENPGSQKLITQVNESVGKVNESIKTVSDSVNAIADDEDLVLVESENQEEEINKKLKFADKAYNASAFSGMGRAYLRKNMVASKNVLTQAMVGSANTRYIIQYDYDLNGQTITVPEGCTLDFQGGSLKNGEILLNSAIIQSDYEIFNEIILKGKLCNNSVKAIWFGAKSSLPDNFQKIQDAIDSAKNTQVNKVVLSNGKYSISRPLLIYGSGNYNGKDFTELIGSGVNNTIISKITSYDFNSVNSAIILVRDKDDANGDLYNSKIYNMTILSESNGIVINGNCSEVILSNCVINANGESGICVYASGDIWQSTFENLFFSAAFGIKMNKSGTSNCFKRLFAFGCSKTAYTLRGNYSFFSNLACDECTGICYDLSYGNINMSGVGSESLNATNVFKIGQDSNVNISCGCIFTPTNDGNTIYINGHNSIVKFENVDFGNSAYPRDVNKYLAKSDSDKGSCNFIDCHFYDNFLNGYFANGYYTEGFYFSIKNANGTELSLRSCDNGPFLPFSGIEGYNMDEGSKNIKFKASSHYFGLSSNTPLKDWNGRDLQWYKGVKAGSIFEPLVKDNILYWICTESGGFLRDCKFRPVFLGIESGPSEMRPNVIYNENTLDHNFNPVYIGKQYFDTTLNKPIWWTGEKWVDSSGNAV